MCYFIATTIRPAWQYPTSFHNDDRRGPADTETTCDTTHIPVNLTHARRGCVDAKPYADQSERL
jgi:hypothetical protein